MYRSIGRAFGIMVALVCLCFAVNSFAEEKATKEECIAKCKEAAAMVKESGTEAAFAKIQDPKGPFVWKDSYVFCVSINDGIMKAHPIKPKLVGQMIKGLKDVNGKMFVVEYINLARDKGEGWVSYMWPKPGEKEPTPKSTYILRVPGADLLMAAGVNE